MEKTYEIWTPIKIERNNEAELPRRYREGEIYWCYLGENIGSEQDGTAPAYIRPVMIIRGFSKRLVICIPISSNKEKTKYTLPIKVGEIDGVILLSQIRAIDTARLTGAPIAKTSSDLLYKVKQAATRLIMKR